MCKDIGQPAERVIHLYQAPNGNDVFMSCAYEAERQSKFNRKSKCDPKAFGKSKKAGPVENSYYECKSDGKLQLLLCSATGGGCKDAFAPQLAPGTMDD